MALSTVYTVAEALAPALRYQRTRAARRTVLWR